MTLGPNYCIRRWNQCQWTLHADWLAGWLAGYMVFLYFSRFRTGFVSSLGGFVSLFMIFFSRYILCTCKEETATACPSVCTLVLDELNWLWFYQSVGNIRLNEWQRVFLDPKTNNKKEIEICWSRYLLKSGLSFGVVATIKWIPSILTACTM